MTFKQIKIEQKQELKQLSKTIRALKNQRKSVPYGFVKGLSTEQWIYRARHVAYCMFLGTPYEKIELNQKNLLVAKAVKDYADILVARMYDSLKEAANEQNVCNNETGSN